ncbi:hypothetical protein os1_15250 [Comamonadaceae bacterium OS-1]|nr:hypothetical protein os1_15250 [Comamonadaceae bacterium OS-1]
MSETKPPGPKKALKPGQRAHGKTAKATKPKKEHWSVEFFRRVDAWGDALRENEKHSKA